MGLLRRKVQEGANGAAGALPRAQFQNLPEQDERGDDRGGFEIDGDDTVHVAKRSWENLREERSHEAIEIRCACAEADQREHIEAAKDERGPEALEKRPAAPKDYRSRQE